jgi:hypothetical protein
LGSAEEVSTTGGTTTTTAYYYAGGKRIGLLVNGVVSYLVADGLGSATVTLFQRRERDGRPAVRALRRGAVQQRHHADDVWLHRPAARTRQRCGELPGIGRPGQRHGDPEQ